MFKDIDGRTKVIYHSTCVVSFTEGSIILNSGGWRTATTKARMNQASNQFRLGYYVYQKKGQWFVDFMGNTFEFEDNMELNYLNIE